MALQGTIDSFALADVMRLLTSSTKTGRLIVNGDRGSANLWLERGALVGASSSAQPSDAGLVEVVFDILRYASGSFIFETDSPCPTPIEPAAVEPVLAEAEAALAEWNEIRSVVPSSRSWLTLAPELPYPEVVLDQTCWASIVAVGSGSTVTALGESLSLAELPSLRLVRALVGAGFLCVGAEVPDESEEPQRGAALVALPSRHPADDPGLQSGVDVPFDEALAALALDEADAFDPDGLDHYAEDEFPPPSLRVASDSDDFLTSLDGVESTSWDLPEVEAEAVASSADVERSRSMLSSKAAEALAALAVRDDGTESSAPTEMSDDDERSRMLKFLGSV